MAARVTFEAMAALLGEPASTVAFWVKSKGCPRTLDRQQLDAWLTAWKASNSAKGGGESESHAAEVSKLRLARAAVDVKQRAAQAGLTELRLQEKRGTLIALDVVEAEFASLGETLKRLLLSLPKQIAAELVDQDGPSIERTLRTEIEKRLRILQSRNAKS